MWDCFNYKTIITPNQERCFLCHRQASEGHHIFYGRANRKKSDEDGLVIPICRKCHSEIHDKGLHQTLKRVGQKIYMRVYGKSEDEFRARYGKSYLYMKDQGKKNYALDRSRNYKKPTR